VAGFGVCSVWMNITPCSPAESPTRLGLQYVLDLFQLGPHAQQQEALSR
jgi:hypothetical protein